jgi:hypothetical protein
MFPILSCGESGGGEPPGTSKSQSADWIALPPAREEFSSPGGSFLFALTVTEKRSVGELFEVRADRREFRFRRDLPHEYRPRFAAVSDEGHVLLLDEWINIASRYAVMVLDAKNEVVAEHDFHAVANALGVPGSEIVPLARHGSWLQSPPSLGPGEETATVEAAGKVLRINLRDGTLSLDR